MPQSKNGSKQKPKRLRIAICTRCGKPFKTYGGGMCAQCAMKIIEERLHEAQTRQD